jgi:hypothetical protein
MDDRTEQAFVDTLKKAADAQAELLKAVRRLEGQVKELAARVEALERLRSPRPVPPPRSG